METTISSVSSSVRTAMCEIPVFFENQDISVFEDDDTIVDEGEFKGILNQESLRTMLLNNYIFLGHIPCDREDEPNPLLLEAFLLRFGEETYHYWFSNGNCSAQSGYVSEILYNPKEDLYYLLSDEDNGIPFGRAEDLENAIRGFFDTDARNDYLTDTGSLFPR